jgi:hypothetical protein
LSSPIPGRSGHAHAVSRDLERAFDCAPLVPPIAGSSTRQGAPGRSDEEVARRMLEVDEPRELLGHERAQRTSFEET